MSDTNDEELEVYTYQGMDGEKVPETAEKLIVGPGVQILPDDLCNSCTTQFVDNDLFSFLDPIIEVDQLVWAEIENGVGAPSSDHCNGGRVTRHLLDHVVLCKKFYLGSVGAMLMHGESLIDRLLQALFLLQG